MWSHFDFNGRIFLFFPDDDLEEEEERDRDKWPGDGLIEKKTLKGRCAQVQPPGTG